MYKLVLISSLAAIAALVLANIGGPGAGPRAELTFNNEAEVNTLDPHRMSWARDIRIANALFEGLMAFRVEAAASGPASAKPGQESSEVTVVPGVAERYELSEDGLTYTFHLRENARWSNGEPVTAEDFRWSWRRVMTPITASDYYGMMFVIRGAREYHEALLAGKPASFDDVGIRAPDGRTLVVTLRAPTAYFLDLAAFVPFMPVYPPLLERYRKEGGPRQNGICVYDEGWTRPENLVSNGPFVLASHWFKREIVLQKSPTYWDAGSVRLNRVRALAVEDLSASLNTYESGGCDMITSVPDAAARPLMAMSPGQRRRDYYSVPAFGTYFYRCNCQKTARGRANPFADPRVRKAFALSVDRRGIVMDVTGVRQPEAGTLIPAGLTVQDAAGRRITYEPPEGGFTFDPAAARKLLDEAGYGDRARLGEVVLLLNNSVTHEPIAERLASTWRAELGANVILEKKDANAFGQALKQKEDKAWHLGRGGWYGDYRDPSTFLEMLVTGDGNNDSGYSNPRFDGLVAAAAATGDQAERMRLFRQAEQLVIVDEAALIPIYYYLNTYLIRPRVHGAYPNAMATILLKQMWVDEGG